MCVFFKYRSNALCISTYFDFFSAKLAAALPGIIGIDRDTCCKPPCQSTEGNSTSDGTDENPRDPKGGIPCPEMHIP